MTNLLQQQIIIPDCQMPIAFLSPSGFPTTPEAWVRIVYGVPYHQLPYFAYRHDDGIPGTIFIFRNKPFPKSEVKT